MSQTFSRPSNTYSALAAIVTVAALGLCGCASIPEDISNPGTQGPIAELDATPFYPQERYQCGPAALATMMTQSGIEVALETITELTYIPERQGSLQTELMATARQYDRVPYRIDGTMAALAAELLAGRPVLVLQNLGVSWYPRWHYAVVIGIDTASNDVILRSGTDRRRITHAKTFLRTWKRGNYWGVVILRPDELPASPDRTRFLQAVANVEAAGRYDAAMSAWTTALGEWPEDPVALFGKASTAFRLGDLGAAEQSYLALLRQNPDMHAARNNLAYVLAAQGNITQALAEMRIVLEAVDGNDPLRDEYESSLRELEDRAAQEN